MMYMKKMILLLVCAYCSVAAFSQRNIPQVKIEAIEKIIAASDTPMVINFWATFCAPCIKEMPYLSSITDSVNRNSPVKLLFVSLDLKESYPDKISRFLLRKMIPNDCVWLNETNADYFCPKIDAKWSGAIPATLFINNKTGYRKFMEQEISPDEFRKQLNLLLK
jgi:thiol-disulfide isomerase/thioredoxin